MSAIFIDGHFYYDNGTGSEEFPEYQGEYVITPDVEDQILNTKNTTLIGDIKINKIPLQEVSNPTGGTTVIIG